MSNGLADCNDHLFDQLKRLSDKSLSGDKLKDEIERSKAVVDVTKTILTGQSLALDAVKVVTTGLVRIGDVPEQLRLDSTKVIAS